jgi:hypothetical protein
MLYSRFFAKDMRKDILTGFGGPASGGGLLRSYPSEEPTLMFFLTSADK